MAPEAETACDGKLACALLLVMMGADANKKLVIPDDFPQDTSAYSFQQRGLGGVTAKQMAVMSRRAVLIYAISLMEDNKEAIECTYCRCGSRLPWSQCHAAPEQGDDPHYVQKDGRLCWRYSPLAPCKCGHTGKKHFKCCWVSSSPAYLDDETGTFSGAQWLHDENWARDCVNNREFSRLLDMEQDEWLSLVSVGVFDSREKSKMSDWDWEVCVGCMERLEASFMWHDLHWRLDKSELLYPVEEWNDALEQHCDDMGLGGEERQAIVAQHTTSSLAPYANTSCATWETRAREFKCCSRCKRVVCCSRDCQKEHRKEHKKHCARVVQWETESD